MTNYLVTGATGELGGKVLNYLKDIDNVYALARNEEKAKDLSVPVRFGDYSDYNSLVKAFEGVDRLLFISAGVENRQANHENVVNAAKESGVSFIVYTSLTNAQESTSMLAPDHKFTENVINESGIKHTFIRNNWYFENEIPAIKGALKTGKFYYLAENGRTAWALKREYAEAAALVLTGDNFPEVLELSGHPITYEELGEAIKNVTGEDIEVARASKQDYEDNLVAGGLPREATGYFGVIQADIKKGVLDFESNDFEKVLGKPLTPLDIALKELLKM